jgi:DNA-binding transcriptional MerR regulator
LAKAVEAFRNIGEVSAELGVKKHVLRFWEIKFPQLRPMKRGGGRRLYRPADVELLCGIRDLLQTAGYTIKGVQKILREQGIDQVKKIASVSAPAADKGAGSGRAGRIMGEMQPLVLGQKQVAALRSVIAELDTCRILLGAKPLARATSQRIRRSA